MFFVWSALVLAFALARPVQLEWALEYFTPPTLVRWTWGGAAEALGRHARLLGVLAGLGLAVLGAGGPPRRWLGKPGAGQLAWHLRWIAGLVASSLVLLGLGFAGLLQPGLLGGALVIAAVAGLRAARRRGARDPGRARGRDDAAEAAGARWVGLALAALALTGFAVALLAALAPQIEMDAQVFYYASPRKALALHRYVAEEAALTDGYPHGFELLYIPAFVAGGDQAAKVLTWLELALTGAALAGMLRAAGAPPLARRLAHALFWTAPFTGLLPHVSYSDAAVMHAAAVAWWLLPAGTPRLVALLAGWTLALKYSAVVVAVPLLLLAWRTRPRAWPWILALGAAPALPWWARNFFAHGQPFYPLLSRLFPTYETAWVLEPLADFTPVLRGYGGASVLRRLGAMWGAHAGDDIARVSSFGAAWLLPAALGAGGVRAGALTLALVVWAGPANTVLRYLEPAVPWVLALGVLTLARRGWLLAGALAGMLLAGQGLVEGLARGYLAVNPVAVVVGAERPLQYVRRIVPPIPHYMTIADESAIRFRGGRTYVLGDVKAYFWEGRFVLDELTFKPHLARWIEESDGPHRLRIKFRQHDVRHVVYRAEGMRTITRMGKPFAWTPERLRTYERFWTGTMATTGQLVVPAENVAYYLFDLTPGRGSPWPSPRGRFTLPGTEQEMTRVPRRPD